MGLSAVKRMFKYFTVHNTECKDFRELVHNSGFNTQLSEKDEIQSSSKSKLPKNPSYYIIIVSFQTLNSQIFCLSPTSCRRLTPGLSNTALP